MASLDEDKIDFDKLDQELQAAREADAKYWRENDAKFRAVNQKVATYEEFRDIVLASHLKPLEKGDKIGETFNQPWNIHAGKSRGEKDEKDASTIKQDRTQFPKNSQEFTRDWKRYCKTHDEKYNFLFQIGCEHLKKIFKSEISSLGDFFETFGNVEGFSSSFVLEFLDMLTCASRFELSIDFLSKRDKEACKKMFERLRRDVSKEENSVEFDEKIGILEKKYELS